MNKFHLVVTGRNCKDYIKTALMSCLYQNYDADKFIITYGDDGSTDGTLEIAKSYENKFKNFKVVTTEKRLFQNLNIQNQLLNYSEPGMICVTVDGDDWLTGTGVLKTLDRVYSQNDLWMTYGLYEEVPYRDVSSFYRSYSDDCIRNNKFREENWYASHLRTFKRELYLKIKTEDFYDKDGEPFKFTGDKVMMYPMLEMSGFRSKFINEVLYIYNKTNELSEDKINQKAQMDVELYVRSKPKYNVLNEL
jgi:glycosyltransferase involved in cell wall biosynthesis